MYVLSLCIWAGSSVSEVEVLRFDDEILGRLIRLGRFENVLEIGPFVQSSVFKSGNVEGPTAVTVKIRKVITS